MRTDLAAECLKEKELPEGIISKSESFFDGEVSVVEINSDEAARKIGKPKGIYISFDLKPFWEEQNYLSEKTEFIAEVLRDLLPKKGGVLVVGLGNREITPDALGPSSAEKILVTRHLSKIFPELRTVASISPNVLGKTGLEAVETIRSVVNEVKPAAVIVIDALASASAERLGSVIQLTDSGIAPGSGVLNSRKVLNRGSLNVPVIAIGMPTVTDVSQLLQNNFNEPMMCTPRQIDLIIQKASNFLAACINRALHPSLSLEDLILLQS